jgi:hypothetical protein
MLTEPEEVSISRWQDLYPDERTLKKLQYLLLIEGVLANFKNEQDILNSPSTLSIQEINYPVVCRSSSNGKSRKINSLFRTFWQTLS